MFATFMPVALYLQASFIVTFNSLNYPDWSEQFQLHLNVLNLDLVLFTKRPSISTDEINTEERSLHKA